MSDLELDFQRLVDEIRAELDKRGIEFQFRTYGNIPGRKYSFKAPKTFAWVYKKPRLDCLAVGTKQEWADKAGIEDYQYKPHSQFNRPGAHWKISEGDITSRQKIIRYLIRVCKARHSDI